MLDRLPIKAARRRWRRLASGLTLSLAALATAGCDLDLENPNAPTEEEVLSSIDGQIALGVGMQSRFAFAIDDYMVTNSLVTDEWGTRSQALISYISLFTGENFDESFLVVEAPWARSYETIKAANTLLNAQDVGLGPGFEAGLSSLAKLFKAMSLGMLIMQYDEVVIDITQLGPLPQPRAVVLDTILELLESARTDLANIGAADLAGFSARVLSPGFDLRNTIDAMLARYYLMDGQFQQAIDAADRVDLDVLSVFNYPSPQRNPIQDLAFQTAYVAGLQSFVDEAEPGDQRPAYWLEVGAAPLTANPPDSVIIPLRQYSGANDPFPIYLPDEMQLIQAEALTSLGQYAAAAALVNAVRTQSSSSVDEPIAGLAALPATALDTEDELLAQIAYERRYELYMQGMRWEDTRRLGTSRTTTPTLPFLPIPPQECRTNPSNPCG